MSRCSECGAVLPEEIEPGTGVYCSECGHGQLVTDGGEPADGIERPSEGVLLEWEPGEGIRPVFSPSNDLTGVVIGRDAFMRLSLELTISFYPHLVSVAADRAEGPGPASKAEIRELLDDLTAAYGLGERSYVDLPEDLDASAMDPNGET